MSIPMPRGADIYRDPKQRYVVKIADVISELDRTPWVNDQGNLFMGRDGIRYEVTSHPELVDKLGVLREATHAPEELCLDPNMPGPSNAQYREPTLDDLLFVDLNLGDDPKGKTKMHEVGSN